jgi:hypothetical protein
MTVYPWTMKSLQDSFKLSRTSPMEVRPDCQTCTISISHWVFSSPPAKHQTLQTTSSFLACPGKHNHIFASFLKALTGPILARRYPQKPPPSSYPMINGAGHCQIASITPLRRPPQSVGPPPRPFGPSFHRTGGKQRPSSTIATGQR